jgi:phosphatidylglycerophosphate synthase
MPTPESPSTTARSPAGAVLTTFTLARLLLIPAIILTFMRDPFITTAALVVFMFTDLGDGVIARLLRVEDLRRRALDSVVDRIAIDSCLIAAATLGAMSWPIVAAFIVRDIYCAAICVRMVRDAAAVIKADLFYRGLNAGIAAWAISAPFLGSSARAYLALALLAAAAAVALDLTRCTARVRQNEDRTRGQIVPAGIARRLSAPVKSTVPTFEVMTRSILPGTARLRGQGHERSRLEMQIPTGAGGATP